MRAHDNTAGVLSQLDRTWNKVDCPCARCRRVEQFADDDESMLACALEKL